MRFRLFLFFFFLLSILGEAGSGCGFYKTGCMAEKKSFIEFLAEEDTDENLILVTKHEYFYRTSDCSGSISMELTSNYSLVFLNDDSNDYFYDLTTLTQIVVFNDDYYLTTIHNCSEVEVGISYTASSSYLELMCKYTFDPYLDIKKVHNAKLVIKRKSFSFPDLYDYPTNKYYTATYQSSLGCIQDGSSVNGFLIFVIILLIIVIACLIYYQRNYRYIPITERKRMDLPKSMP